MHIILDELCTNLGMDNILSKEEIAGFQFKATVLELPANTNLLLSGKQCTKIWYLFDGVVRMYNKSHRRELTLHLFTNSRFITDFISVKTKEPTKYNIQTVIPSTIIEFEASDLFSFLDTSLNFERVGRKIFETLLLEETARLQDVLFLDATERYKKLWQSKPEYFMQIPQKYIASYLKISPETLSRIKKENL